MERFLGVSRTIAANFTRPNDTNQYTAGDVLCDSTSAPTIITFARAAREQKGNGIIQSALMVSSANQATKPDLRLWLFDTTITMDNDNAAFTPTDAELRTLVAVIAFPVGNWIGGDATSGAGGNAVCNPQALWLPFNCTVSNDLFGVLEVRNTYTPVAQERFDIRLGIID